MSSSPHPRHDANNVVVISSTIVKYVHGEKPYRVLELAGEGRVRIPEHGYDTLEEAQRQVTRART